MSIPSTQTILEQYLEEVRVPLIEEARSAGESMAVTFLQQALSDSGTLINCPPCNGTGATGAGVCRKCGGGGKIRFSVLIEGIIEREVRFQLKRILEGLLK